MAIISILKDEAAKSLLETLKTAKIKPYTDEQRKATDNAIERILNEKQENINHDYRLSR